MGIDNFISIGENIHCTRSVKSGGTRTTELPGGGEGVTFKYLGEDRILPVPADWAKISPCYPEGKLRHITLAIHQALKGSGENKTLGEEYLRWAIDRQVENGADYLDINVDEYSNNLPERIEIMKWLVAFVSGHSETPLCIDSSNVETLAAGLECCVKGVGLMVNSISLEREDAVEVALHHKAHAIVSAAGKTGLPSTIEERLDNFQGIVDILDHAGMPREKMFLDGLVLPISVDPVNAQNFINASAQAKTRFEGVNLSGGLSNVSFGMPNRKLLNLVFTMLFIEAGGNAGIVDPVQISVESLKEFDMESEPAKLARAVLDGSDMYGGEYIAAFREGRL
ncbi:MAG: dihydropteroate synthase [Planctomycetes bacterium]|nr:dihydropteroate synthase [Planctomycetota bacterium]